MSFFKKSCLIGVAGLGCHTANATLAAFSATSEPGSVTLKATPLIQKNNPQAVTKTQTRTASSHEFPCRAVCNQFRSDVLPMKMVGEL